MPTLVETGARVDDPAERLGAAALATVGIGGGLVLARSVLPFGLACPMHTLTGIPCPGCGLTRLADTVARGQVLDAASADPAGLSLLAAVGVLAAVAVSARTGLHRAGAPFVRAVALLAGVACAVRWLTMLVGGIPAA